METVIMFNSVLFCSQRAQGSGVVARIQYVGKVLWVFIFVSVFIKNIYFGSRNYSLCRNYTSVFQLKEKIDHTRNRFIIGSMALHS